MNRMDFDTKYNRFSYCKTVLHSLLNQQRDRKAFHLDLLKGLHVLIK